MFSMIAIHFTEKEINSHAQGHTATNPVEGLEPRCSDSRSYAPKH